MILVCYDGSEDARAAISRAAALFPAQDATVLTVWQPFVEVVAHHSVGLGLVTAPLDSADIDEVSIQRAQKIAHDGAELAKDAGLEAEPRVCQEMSTMAQTILGEAERLDAEVIVMGSRGLTGLKSLVLGSVSHEVIQHADRTVAVVPSPTVAASRARKAQEHAVAIG